MSIGRGHLCTGIINSRETTTAFLCQRHSGVTVSGQELFLVVARSECAALRRRMPCRQNRALLLCVLTLSANNWKLTCSRALT